MRSFSTFFESDRPVTVRGCDCPGCSSSGDYRAPKSRTLNEYYHFCLDHVREYNKNWDFFAGMSGSEIEHYIRDATVWERPTWPLGEWQKREQQIRDQVVRDFYEGEGAAFTPPSAMPKAEKDALSVLELIPPVTFVEIKTQYRLLVKKHHPDANGGSQDAEEKFKSINQAFTVLKQLYNADDAA